MNENEKGSFMSENAINRLKADYFEKGLKANNPDGDFVKWLKDNQITTESKVEFSWRGMLIHSDSIIHKYNEHKEKPNQS